MSAAALSAFQLAYQINPIILVGGIALGIPGGKMSVAALTQGTGASFSIVPDRLDDFFAQFEPVPGATLVDQDVATYPFANQATAANAVIANSLAISMLMICPMRPPDGSGGKLATMTALAGALKNHNAMGGTYDVATPSYIYTGCVMRLMRDVSSSETKQKQVSWQLDFAQPLLTISQLAQVQNNMMAQLSAGTPCNGQWTSPSTATGPGTAPGVPPQTVPSTIGAPSANVGTGATPQALAGSSITAAA